MEKLEQKLDNLSDFQKDLILETLDIQDKNTDIKALFNDNVEKRNENSNKIICSIVEATNNLDARQTENLSDLFNKDKNKITTFFEGLGDAQNTVFDSSLGKSFANLLNEFVRREFNMDFSGNYTNEVAEYEYQRFLKRYEKVLGNDILTNEKKNRLRDTLRGLYSMETDPRDKDNYRNELVTTLDQLKQEWKAKNGKNLNINSHLFLNSVCNSYGSEDLQDAIDRRFFMYQREKRNEMKKFISNIQTFDSSPIFFRGLNLPKDQAEAMANDILKNGETGRMNNIYENVVGMYTTGDETGRSDFRSVTNYNYLSYTIDSNVAVAYSSNQSGTKGERSSVIFVNAPKPNDEFLNIIDHNDLKQLHEVLRINTEPDEYVGYFINDQDGKYRFVLNENFHGLNLETFKIVTGEDYDPNKTYTRQEVSNFSKNLEVSKDFFEQRIILDKIYQHKTMATELLKPENDEILDQLLEQDYFKALFSGVDSKEQQKEFLKAKLEEINSLSDDEIKDMAKKLNDSRMQGNSGRPGTSTEIPFDKLFRSIKINGSRKSAFVYSGIFDILKEKQPDLAQKILNETQKKKIQQTPPQPLVQQSLQQASTQQLTPRQLKKQQEQEKKQQQQEKKRQDKIKKQQDDLAKELANENKKLAILEKKQEQKLASLKAKQETKLARLVVKHDELLKKKKGNVKGLTNYEKENISIYKDDTIRDSNKKRDTEIRESEVELRKELANTVGFFARRAVKKKIKNKRKEIENRYKQELRTNLAQGVKDLTEQLMTNRTQNTQVNTNKVTQQQEQQGRGVSHVAEKRANDINKVINQELGTTTNQRI